MQLLTICLGCCAASCRVPPGLVELRDHVAKHTEPQSLKWDLSTLMISYANLSSEIKEGKLSYDDCIDAYFKLDAEFEALSLNVPESWEYTTRFLDQKSDRCYTSYFNVYPGRHITQAWNVIRLVRILLNEFILEHIRGRPERLPQGCTAEAALDNIASCAFDICASVPQYVDCLEIARDVISPQEESKNPTTLSRELAQVVHAHTPDQNLACHILLFPLTVAGQSQFAPDGLKSWIIKELHYIANHFYMRNAEVMAQILEGGIKISPWDIYSTLGSYAFVA